MNRLVVVSNRVPDPQSEPQAGGLAVALAGLLARQGGLWFGWSGKVTHGVPSATPDIQRDGTLTRATIDLSAEEYTRYYNNFSNTVLWPLLHTMPELVAFDRRDAAWYRAVNARMAEALAPLLRPNDLIWIHDYHLLPLAAALRARGIRNPIGFFLHIPLAAPDVLQTCPGVPALVRELLAADLIGFQTRNDADNFASLAAETGALPVTDGVIAANGRRVRTGVFPVEIDAGEFAACAGRMAAGPEAAALRRSLGDETLILGVDRLDPTKGLPQRIAGWRRLLERAPEFRGRATMLQIAALSRKDVAPYRALRAQLEREAGALNADFGTPVWQPLRLVAQAGARDTIGGYMRLARVGMVTPLRDGMNLVAKEYVAAQDPDDPGVLVLSRFAGAAQQLEAALCVNPHDTDAMAEALGKALSMPRAERRARWRALWHVIAPTTSLGWGRSFLDALVEIAAAMPGSERLPESLLGLLRRTALLPTETAGTTH